MNNLAIDKNSGTDNPLEFKLLAERTANVFVQRGLKTKPYHDAALPYFSKLPADRQAAALQRLRVFNDSIQATLSAGESINNSSQALWHALRTLGFRTDSEIFSKFENDDVIEVYDSQGTQIWRNFNYMAICSYTFEELLCHDWPTLYVRDAKLTESLIGLMVDTVSSGQRGPRFIDVDYHPVEERFSEETLRLFVRHDYICPLFSADRQCDGFIVTSKVKILGRSNHQFKSVPEIQA